MMGVFTWIITFVSLAGTVLNVRKNILCFYLWAIGNVASYAAAFPTIFKRKANLPDTAGFLHYRSSLRIVEKHHLK